MSIPIQQVAMMQAVKAMTVLVAVIIMAIVVAIMLRQQREDRKAAATGPVQTAAAYHEVGNGLAVLCPDPRTCEYARK